MLDIDDDRLINLNALLMLISKPPKYEARVWRDDSMTIMTIKGNIYSFKKHPYVLAHSQDEDWVEHARFINYRSIEGLEKGVSRFILDVQEGRRWS